MSELHAALAPVAVEWRDAGYPSDRYPAIREVLSFALEGEPPTQLRYLRAAQLRALETYGYLRLIETTPRIPALHERRCTSAPERFAAVDLILAPQIDDWRSMVDSVAIDAAYDGVAFDVDLIDVPECKSDVVTGVYEVEISARSALPVAVRITDTLGGEIPMVESQG
jgi:hypothetical protein